MRFGQLFQFPLTPTLPSLETLLRRLGTTVRGNQRIFRIELIGPVGPFARIVAVERLRRS